MPTPIMSAPLQWRTASLRLQGPTPPTISWHIATGRRRRRRPCRRFQPGSDTNIRTRQRRPALPPYRGSVNLPYLRGRRASHQHVAVTASGNHRTTITVGRRRRTDSKLPGCRSRRVRSPLEYRRQVPSIHRPITSTIRHSSPSRTVIRTSFPPTSPPVAVTSMSVRAPAVAHVIKTFRRSPPFRSHRDRNRGLSHERTHHSYQTQAVTTTAARRTRRSTWSSRR